MRDRFLQTCQFAFLEPQSLSMEAVMHRLHDVLIGSFFLVMVTVGCVGAAMCDQAAAQAMRLLGDQSFIGPEYIVLGFEEYGPLIVSLAFAARIGAGFAAEVAILQSEQTLDALEIYGAKPTRMILAPMGLACVIGCTSLGLFSIVTWEISGMVTMGIRHQINVFTFFRPDAVSLSSITLCISKCSLFGLAVFLSSLKAGLSSGIGSEEIGHATTKGVVWSAVSCLGINLLLDIIWFTARGTI